MAEKSKRRAKPLLVAGAGIALLTMASGSLSCGNLPAPRCGDGGVQDVCSPLFGQQPEDGGTDGGSDGGVLGGDQ
jgi:hypothetical protein